MLKRKLIAFVMLFIMVITNVIPAFSADVLYGDVDGDGKITATDSAYLLNHKNGVGLSELQKKAAAVIDGKSIGINEANAILQKVLNPEKQLKPNTSNTTEATTQAQEVTTEKATETTTQKQDATTEKPTEATTQKPVTGQLKVVDGQLKNSSNSDVQLKGYSTNGTWNMALTNEYSINQLYNSGANTIRIDMYASSYDTASVNTVSNVIDIAAAKKMYSVINWHFDYDNPAPSYSKANAIKFFSELSNKYKSNPYVIYEICSAQGDVSWNDIASYANEVIPKIRENAKNAIIIVGTPNWNQYVDEAQALSFDNIMYSIQLSAGSHSLSAYQKRIDSAKAKGLAVFATQIKTTNDSNTSNNLSETKKWLDYFDNNKISWCAFALEAGSSKSSMLKADSNSNQWNENSLTDSGKLFINRFKGINDIEQSTETTEKPTEFTTADVSDNGYNGVKTNGWLKVIGTNLCNQNGEPFQLTGMSSHGIMWYPQFTEEYSIKKTKEYGANLFRGAMYTAEYNGYCSGNADGSYERICKIVDTAIANDMYVIVDWHILSDYDPLLHKEDAKEFFKKITKKYGDKPNVLYEICNEPNGGVTWDNNIKPYAEEIIPIIRTNAPHSIVIVGTDTWSQGVDNASRNKLTFDNVMYSFHFYSGTHKYDTFIPRLQTAMNNGCAIFATEWGTTDASGNGGYDPTEAQRYINFFKENNISWANWSLSDKGETSAAIKNGADANSWTIDDLTDSGKFVFSNF